MQIWKFPLEVMSEQEVAIPAGYRVLDLQVQDGQPHFWALVDQTAPTVTMKVWMQGTGYKIASNLRLDSHLGTVQLNGFVWHYFDITQP